MHDALSPSLILVLMCCVLLSPLLQLESIQEQLDGLHEQLNTLSGQDHMQERSVFKLCTYRLDKLTTLPYGTKFSRSTIFADWFSQSFCENNFCRWRAQ